MLRWILLESVGQRDRECKKCYKVPFPRIPLAARIIAVADTFDASSSSRAYRKAKSLPEAMAILEAVAGSQLDPHLVKVFQQIYQEDLASEKERSDGR